MSGRREKILCLPRLALRQKAWREVQAWNTSHKDESFVGSVKAKSNLFFEIIITELQVCQ